MLAYIAAGIAGFVAFLYGAVFAIQLFDGSMRYEDGLPIILVSGAAGCLLAVLLVRRHKRRKPSR